MLYQLQCSFNVTRTTDGRRGRNMVEHWTLKNFNKYCSSANSSSSNSRKYIHDEIFGVKTTFCTPVFRSSVGLCMVISLSGSISNQSHGPVNHRHQRAMQSGHQQSICNQQSSETNTDKKIAAHGRIKRMENTRADRKIAAHERMNNKWQIQVKQKREMTEMKKKQEPRGWQVQMRQKKKWQTWKKTNPVCWQN